MDENDEALACAQQSKAKEKGTIAALKQEVGGRSRKAAKYLRALRT